MKVSTNCISIMTTKTAIRLLNNKKTTGDDILNRLKKMIDKFQLEREDYYTDEWAQEMKDAKKDMSKEELFKLSKDIAKRINQDTIIFVKTYVKDMTDEMLDAINNKQISKDNAHVFLIMLQGMKQAFEN